MSHILSDIDLSMEIPNFLSIGTLAASLGDKRRVFLLTSNQHRCLEYLPRAMRKIYCFFYVECSPLTT